MPRPKRSPAAKAAPAPVVKAPEPPKVDAALLDKVKLTLADRWEQLPQETWTNAAAVRILADGIELDLRLGGRLFLDDAIVCVRNYFTALRAMRAVRLLSESEPQPEKER